MIARPLLVALAAISMVAAACTTEESSNPAPTLTSTTSSTSTTSTTTVPATTTPPSTVADTTTVPEPTLPAGPVDAVVPLFTGGDEGGWLYLGSWQFDQWLEAADDEGTEIVPSISPGTPATISNLDLETAGSFGAPTDSCFDDRTGPTVDIVVAAPEPPGYGYPAVALPTPSWALKPRPVAVSASGPDTYETLGQEAFAGDPVDATLGAVEQLVVTDLDGDGDDEALVIFEYIQSVDDPGTRGDMASLLLVDAVTRGASTVQQNFVDADLDPDDFPAIERYRILDVADLNGDGRMEVVVHAWYYEGASVVIYTYDGAELSVVLANGCGA